MRFNISVAAHSSARRISAAKLPPAGRQATRGAAMRTRPAARGWICLLLAALVVFVAAVCHHALATEPTVITLSCGGTVKNNAGQNKGRREAISKVGVVIDLAENTVSFAGFVAQIENVDGAVVFFGSGIDPAIGDIDRVTGVMSATTVSGNVDTSYELFCKPVTRLDSQKK